MKGESLGDEEAAAGASSLSLSLQTALRETLATCLHAGSLV